ncbi:hypothetical protein [Bacillus altitudinis]|uniref:hypothetical protein n=1 Tax=Bacillus altitudinis TaxID=293387 RepID=UPI00071D804B|nr:hypothetical protein [Bacillus altitudinis]KSU65230.1 hypothetical protein AS035_18325 [Bacillus altitudinis]SCC47938.1 hypothetical protein GA0061086_1222 [Bacillus altitudinis]
MKKINRLIIAIISVITVIQLTGCDSKTAASDTPKLDEFIEIISLKQIKDNQYEIEYELKKGLDKGSGLTTQNLYFSNGKKNIPLVSEEKGNQKINIKGNTIKIIFNGSNKYTEEKKIN